jgi:hypothetical protein
VVDFICSIFMSLRKDKFYFVCSPTESQGGYEESTAPTLTKAKSVKSVEGHAKALGGRRSLRSSRLSSSSLLSIWLNALLLRGEKLDY